jgi:hypothetical protein
LLVVEVEVELHLLIQTVVEVELEVIELLVMAQVHYKEQIKV